MATRGRPKGSKNNKSNDIVVDKFGYDSLIELNKKVSDCNEKLIELIDKQTLRIQEMESELGILEDENEHLKEIIKSLAEVL